MNIAIIIDPWEKPELINKILFFLDHVYITISRTQKFIDSMDDIDVVVIASYENVPIQQSLLKWVPKKARKIFFTDEESMRKFLSENKVDNIYMNGTSWDECIRNRPLGYMNLVRIIDDMNLATNICVKGDCVVMSTSRWTLMPITFVPEDNHDWIATSQPGVYKLSWTKSIKNIQGSGS